MFDDVVYDLTPECLGQNPDKWTSVRPAPDVWSHPGEFVEIVPYDSGPLIEGQMSDNARRQDDRKFGSVIPGCQWCGDNAKMATHLIGAQDQARTNFPSVFQASLPFGAP